LLIIFDLSKPKSYSSQYTWLLQLLLYQKSLGICIFGQDPVRTKIWLFHIRNQEQNRSNRMLQSKQNTCEWSWKLILPIYLNTIWKVCFVIQHVLIVDMSMPTINVLFNRDYWGCALNRIILYYFFIHKLNAYKKLWN